MDSAETDSDSDTDEDTSRDVTMSDFMKSCDGKKWAAIGQTSMGIVLLVLEIANVAALNPWYRLFCPGIWIGVIFIATGGISLAFYKLDHLLNRSVNMIESPSTAASCDQIFRIMFLILNALSLSLCVAMIVVLAIVIDALRLEMRPPSDSMFAMTIAMITLYVLVMLTTFLTFFYLVRRNQQTSKLRRECETAGNICTTAVATAEHPV